MDTASCLVLLVSCLALVGCSDRAASDDGSDGTGSGSSGGDGDGTSGDATGSTGSGGAGGGGTLGIVVIDVQETFVDYSSTPDMPGIIERTKAAMSLSEAHDIPLFVTYEASKQGDHALHAPLAAALPAHAQEFVKTTFAATGLAAFAEALQQSSRSHLVVAGAETDVCVLQTVLGLRQMGFTVLLETDALFTSETNTSPALRRMEQAGAMLVNATDVASWAADPSALPNGGDPAVTVVEPLQMGVVLNAFTDAELAASDDALTTQKGARLRELLLVSEWFQLPVYVQDVAAGLPDAYAQYFQGDLLPMSQIGQDTGVTQLVFAGTDAGLAESMGAWIGSRQLFVMEDALLAQGTAAEQEALLEPFFADGMVPITYKSFYYDMTKSVDLSEWPSQEWVARFDEYYWITQAPEDLPPMPAD